MKMKRLLSTLLAALVIASAGCSGNEASDATTTTTAAEAEAAETTAAETTTTEAETTPAETEAVVENPFMTDEIREFIEGVRAEAPIYADFLETSSSLPLTMGFSFESDAYGTGEMMESSMEIGMASPDKFYMSTNTAGVALDIVITDGKYYMVSAAEKTALYMAMTDEEAATMSEEMTASVKASFDPSAATYETGETELDGTTYLYEKITTEETGEIIVYADTATKEVKFISSQGIIMEITVLSKDVDESKLEIPSDYTLIDMSEMMGGTTDTEYSAAENSGDASEVAKNYLEYSAFSYTGLIEQLEFEGFSHEEAVAAVDACGADWGEQAAKKAVEYLEYSAFSYTGLIEQLEYEGFTHEEAVAAVDACGADWDEQAAKVAADYLEYSAFSYTGLIEQLEFDGFTAEQAAGAVDNCGADWNEQAVKSAEEYLSFSTYTRDELIEILEFQGFTAEQAVYGVDANGL